MKKIQNILLLFLTAIPFFIFAQTNRRSGIVGNDTNNNQSNHFYYYYPTNAGLHNVEPLDYKTNRVTLVGKPIIGWNNVDDCPITLTIGESGSFEESLSSFSSHSQKWESILGIPGRNEMGGKVLEHYDHGYLITGNLRTGTGASTYWEGWFVKTNINGQPLWEKKINSIWPDQVIINKALYDKQGNIYVFGCLLQDQPHEFPFVVKLNACGELLWCRLLAIDGYEFGFFNDAIFLDDGDLLGLAIMPEDDPSNNNRILLFRISPEGDLIWKKGYATHENHPYFGDPYGRSIYHFGDIYLISGTVYSPYPNSPNPYHVYQRPMFIGIDENFVEKWIVEFGIQDSLLGKAETVVPINDTLFMGVGRYRFVNENGKLDQSAWLMYFNNKGEEVGYKILVDEQFGQEVLETCLYEVEHIEGDKYLLSTGYLHIEIDDSNKGDLVADTAGNVYNYTIWAHTISGGGIYLTKTFDKKFILNASYRLPGQTTSDILLYKINENLEHDTLYPGNYTYDSLCPYDIKSGVIDLAGCGVITSIGEVPTLEEYRENMERINITAIPNPSSTGKVVLEFENTSSFTNMKLRVYDAFGREIVTKAIISGQGALRVDTSGWADGIYFAVIYSNGGAVGRCKVVVE